MAGHVRVLGILMIVLGSLTLVAGLVLATVLGGIAGIVGMAADDEALVAVPILGAVGVFLFFFLMLLGLPGIIAGWGLLYHQSWARILAIILSVLNLPSIPVGTAVGVYGLWVLLSAEGARLFEARNLRAVRY
ncbi:MAG TPA: hypothetical protein DEH78_06095 [Solibacterales bacterium]|nr:hypothetical protein [Bryobacterales bacterium]